MKYLKKVEYYIVENNKIYNTVEDLIAYDNLKRLISFYEDNDFSPIQFDSKASMYIDQMIEDLKSIIYGEEAVEYFNIDDDFKIEDLIEIQNLCREMIQNNVEICQINYIGTIS